MKNMKKILALVVAVLMIVASMSALAATGGVTIVDDKSAAADKGNHVYKVYQIFTGDLVTIDGVKKLQNVKYGYNYGDTGASVPKDVLDAIQNNDAAARAFAKATAESADFRDDPAFRELRSSNSYSVNDLPSGYYLIVDTTVEDLAAGDTLSRYMIQVLDTNNDLHVKKDVPGGDKVIDDDTLGAGESNPALADTGATPTTTRDNVSVGDTVTFKLTGYVPTDAVDYDKYFFVMNDTLSTGLTFDKTTAAITVTSNKEGKTELAETTDYYVYTGNDCGGNPKHTLEIALKNPKDFAGKTITVTYKATLNADAQMDDLSNPNTYTITYSNNPNHDYDGDEDENHPGKPKTTQDVPTGETPVKRTETYTTGLKIRKIDQDGQALIGASFTITGDSLEHVVHFDEVFTQDANGEYYKLKTGAYTTEAPQTADKMVAAEAGDTDGYVECASTDEGAIEVGGKYYRVVHQGENPAWILKKKNSELYTSERYTKGVATYTDDTSTNHVSADLAVEEDGTLTIKGLGAGSYTIHESVVPQGYSAMDDITVTIAFDDTKAENEEHWSVTSNNATQDDDGYWVVTVKNIAGNVLPSTGGMGTTILYVGGSILVILAAVLLITKRRMNAND